MSLLTLFYITILIISICLVHNFFKLSNLINPFVMFFIYNTIFFFIGIFYINNYGNIFIDDSTKLFVTYGYFMSVVGALLAQFTFSNKIIASQNSILILNENKSNIDKVSALIIFFLGVLLYIYFFLKTGFIPDIFTNFEDERIASLQGFGMVVTLSIIFLCFSSAYLLSSDKIGNLLKIIIFFIATIILLAYGSRAPYLKFLLVLFIVNNFKNNYIISIRRIIPITMFLFFIMVLLGTVRKGIDYNFWDIFFARIGWRPIATIFNFQSILNHFPDYGTLYGGSYFIELKTLLPGFQPNFGTWVKDIIGYKFSGGSLTCSSIGVAYINWGLLGIYVMPLIFGYILQSLYIFFLKSKLITLDKLVFFTFISISLWGVSTVGIATPILYNIIPYSIVYLLFIFLNQLLRLK